MHVRRLRPRTFHTCTLDAVTSPPLLSALASSHQRLCALDVACLLTHTRCAGTLPCALCALSIHASRRRFPVHAPVPMPLRPLVCIYTLPLSFFARSVPAALLCIHAFIPFMPCILVVCSASAIL
ncbi:hypothetical protein EVG20_g11267 [Dentipellis fragilis]|uniref:Uncharacterized protein n=1 Tax=Dentipellis fragilis TaxID=205917 RepID=A0A4Y9XQT9_9AGAM|nr:hypothetical protein EVG20_g11267 [Dentipellis fragilis]